MMMQLHIVVVSAKMPKPDSQHTYLSVATESLLLWQPLHSPIEAVAVCFEQMPACPLEVRQHFSLTPLLHSADQRPCTPMDSLLQPAVWAWDRAEGGFLQLVDWMTCDQHQIGLWLKLLFALSSELMMLDKAEMHLTATAQLNASCVASVNTTSKKLHWNYLLDVHVCVHASTLNSIGQGLCGMTKL